MAVKQNNTDGSGAPASASGTSSGSASLKMNVSGNNVAGGTKSKKMNPSSGGIVGGGATGVDGGGPEGVLQANGCSGPSNINSTIKSKSNSASIGVGSNMSVGGGSGITVKAELSQILQLIDIIELKQQQLNFGQEILKIYRHVILQLASVQMPRQSDEMKRFKEDIIKVGEFLGKASEKGFYFYLRIVCQLITNDEETPSCAIAVIFQLFNAGMVYEAVQSLLSHKISNKNIQKTVRLLSEWLRICNFCQNLNLWIMAILNGLQEQQKIDLFGEIALENIEPLFSSLIIPVLRPKVAPIVFHMLSSISHTPQVFHKILPKFPLVVTLLKQQSNSNEEYAEETKKILQELVDLSSALMVQFYGYDALYAPVEQALKDFRPSFNYLNYASTTRSQNEEGLGGALLQNKNAKVGLVNLGNTCYMNSVLQALAMTKEFSREILLTQTKSPLLIKMQEQIALMLYSMRYELTPSRVLNATRPPGFSPGLQQDSSEFLGYLLETLHENEIAFGKRMTQSSKIGTNSDIDSEPIAKTSKQMISPEQLNSKGNTNAVEVEGASSLAFNNSPTTPNAVGQMPEEFLSKSMEKQQHSWSDNGVPGGAINAENNSNERRTADANSDCGNGQSTIEKTFTGKIATTYKCLTCGWKSRNVDSFRDLQLSFPEVKIDCASNYSVQDLIDYYCSPEKLDGDNQYFCEKCKKLSDAERFINVIRAPKNLILTLKHFKYDQKYHMRAKLMHKVFHDENVSIKVCAADSLEEIASVHYDLYAGVVHSGFSMDSGHYYTYAADAANKWYKFNDSIVTPSKSEELHNLTPPNTPYILFYQMGARSNENLEAACAASTKVIKVEVPTPLTLEELPRELRDYVNHDNCLFNEELKARRLRLTNATLQDAALQAKRNGSRGPRGDKYDDDDEEDQPPPASGCGGNAMNVNVNRFVY